MLPNIAIIGKAGAGKSTLADLLIGRFMYERLSFAEPLKIGCATRDDRGLLQKVGQGVRDLHPDFWVNLAVNELARNRFQPGSNFVRQWVCDDCRYENEAYRLKEEGFVTVRVIAPRDVRLDRLRRNGRLQDESQLEHVSEMQLDGFEEDYTIYNGEAVPEDYLVSELQMILNRERR